MDEEQFDALMGSTNPAMAVVTTAVDGRRSGCLIGFHGQTSIEPRRYCVWISKANHTYGVVLAATHVAVHLLTDADHDLAEVFGGLTGDATDKFELVPNHEGDHGVPILDGCEHVLVGQKVSVADDGGDHVLVTLEPVDARSGGPFTPLRLSDVEDITPGHPSDGADD